MILKNETQGSFVIVSQSIMHDKSLKLFDRGLLITLMSLPDNWNFTINGLVAILSDGRDAIRGGLDRLQEKGYLVKEQLRDDGKFSDNCLRINVIPKKPLSEKPISGNPTTDNPLPEKPMTGIPTQLNNKESSKNKSNNNQSKKNICHISGRKEVKNGADNGKQGLAYKPSGKRWTKDEIDLYGL